MMKTYLTAFLTAFFAVVASASAGFDFTHLENVPLQSGQRHKPYYTFATEALQTISGRATYRDGEKKIPAMEAILDIGLHPHVWAERPLILFDYKPLKVALGLDRDRKHFSLAELSSNEGFVQRLAEVEKLAGGKEKAELDREQREINDVAGRIRLAHSVMEGNAFSFLPHPTGTGWVPVAFVGQAYPGAPGKDVAENWASLKAAFLGNDSAAFTASSEKFAASLAALRPDTYPSAGLMKLETQYGQFHPFRWSWILLASAAIVLGLTSLSGRQAGYRIAWALVIAAFVLQIGGFAARIIIGGRGPVTNMYESVLWVAFGTILFAIIMEAIYRSRYMFLGAIPVAVVCLILADTQTTILDPAINPLSAVLRNNFWLSTHVTSITLSYAAFALALGVGHIILGKLLLGRTVSAALYNYLYRALQIGVLLLAIGTILGGVWANVSWGRFWDWDPKETWALIALLGYLALLHGRIAGWWKGFGLAVGSVLAFQSILMAWYGVNYILGAGLHSYGFGTGGFSGVLTYVIAEIVFVGVVIVKQKRSGKAAAPEPEEVEA